MLKPFVSSVFRGAEKNNVSGEFSMNIMLFKAVGIVLICVGIYFSLMWPLPLIVFGAGLGFLFLS